MTKCYSVRLKEFIQISDKCYLAKAFDGSEALIPMSQYYGVDIHSKNGYFITEWILEKKSLQFSRKNWANFSKDGRNLGKFTVKNHVPKKLNINDFTPSTKKLLK